MTIIHSGNVDIPNLGYKAMSTDQSAQPNNQSQQQNPGTDKKQFWCNFCNFESNDLQDYLSHSCREVITDRGEELPESLGNVCR